MLKLENVWKIFNEGKPNQCIALKNVNLVIEDGEFIAVQGKSGAGKSTLMHILACLDTPTKGVFSINSQKVENFNEKDKAKFRRDFIGIVFQRDYLIDECSVLDNVMLSLNYLHLKSVEKREIAARTLDKVGIKHLYNKNAAQLSGGERQRVAVARAMANERDIILADEPTGSLDSENAKIILDLFKQINNNGKTVIIITHDDDIAKLCNRRIVLADGEIISDLVKKSKEKPR